MYLIDTNIFLEILLKQGKSERCKNFLIETEGEIYISGHIVKFMCKTNKLKNNIIIKLQMSS